MNYGAFVQDEWRATPRVTVNAGIRYEGAAIMVSESADNGATFTAPRMVAETGGMSDHPLLVTSESGVYLSWFAAAEGHRLISL